MEGDSSSKTLEGSTKIVLKLAQAPQAQKDNEKQAKLCAQQLTQALEALEDPEEYLKQFTQVDFPEQKPEWLERFLKRTFFDPCPKHPIRRNELNKYCIDCDASLCQYCLSLASHEDHRLLKIYRHVYKDVVPLDEIERHVDCSEIQPYRCNRQLVIALSPLPHAGTRTNEEVTCQTCKRKLIEYDIYSYCSISCKLKGTRSKPSSANCLSLTSHENEGGSICKNQRRACSSTSTTCSTRGEDGRGAKVKKNSKEEGNSSPSTFLLKGLKICATVPVYLDLVCS